MMGNTDEPSMKTLLNPMAAAGTSSAAAISSHTGGW